MARGNQNHKATVIKVTFNKEKKMEDQIKDFIRSVASGDASEASERLDNLMSQKTMFALNDLRTDMAQKMFNTTTQEAE